MAVPCPQQLFFLCCCDPVQEDGEYGMMAVPCPQQLIFLCCCNPIQVYNEYGTMAVPCPHQRFHFNAELAISKKGSVSIPSITSIHKTRNPPPCPLMLLVWILAAVMAHRSFFSGVLIILPSGFWVSIFVFFLHLDFLLVVWPSWSARPHSDRQSHRFFFFFFLAGNPDPPPQYLDIQLVHPTVIQHSWFAVTKLFIASTRL